MKTQKNPSYTFKKNGIYYFSKAVPRDLREYYKSPRIVRSLRTSSKRFAEKAASRLAVQLEDHWMDLRLSTGKFRLDDFLQATDQGRSQLFDIELGMERYLLTKGPNRSSSFHTGTRRNIGYLIEHLGNRPVDHYTSADAALLRDKLKKKELSPSSLTRIFGSIKAVFNFLITEYGLEFRNPFLGVYIEQGTPEKRTPLSREQIATLQNKCRAWDDELRWLIALISDTGMRLSEAVGLTTEDLNLTTPIPYLVIRPNPHRPLKTTSSRRIIPLVSSSLWAAKKVYVQAESFCFPKYASIQGINSNSASAAANKWLKQQIGERVIIHGLRHSLRDRLRAINTPLDMIDQLGGWSSKTVGQNYGEGYDLEMLHRYMKQIVLT